MPALTPNSSCRTLFRPQPAAGRWPPPPSVPGTSVSEPSCSSQPDNRTAAPSEGTTSARLEVCEECHLPGFHRPDSVVSRSTADCARQL